MLSGFRRGLQTIDFYQAVPSQYCEGTVSGACISLASIVLLVLLSISALMRFQQPKVDSDLIIDQKHLAEKLQVLIDIQFPRYPCGFLSLDVQNVLKVHLVNVGSQKLVKYRLPGNEVYNDTTKSHTEKLQAILSQVKAQQGCRIKGIFQIDRVPGNFHFSCHGYTEEIPELVSNGYRMFDMGHIIHSLQFGAMNSDDPGSRSLSGFRSQKRIEESFMGITYTYFLEIIEKNSVYENNRVGREEYLYTARLNEVILAQFPMVLFRYQTNPVTVLEIVSYESYHELIISLVGILGGIFTVAAIIDSFIHSSIRFLLEKHRMNKLR